MNDERRLQERVGIVESRQDRFEESVNRSLKSIDKHLEKLTDNFQQMHVFDERITRQRADLDTIRGDVELLKQHVPINSFMRDRWNKVTMGILVATAGAIGALVMRLIMHFLVDN